MNWLLVDSSSIGGIERHVATLCQALIQSGVDAKIVLLSTQPANPWLQQLSAAKLPVRVLNGGFQCLVAAIKSDKPALIHTHGYKANILGRLAAALTKIPSVSTFHAGERGPFPIGLYQKVDEITSILSTRLAVSEQIQGHLPYTSTLVRNFIMVPNHPPIIPLPKKIAFVGRLSHEKGPDRFCELARACKLGIEWHMWGDGPMRTQLETDFGDHVTFHGLVTDLEPVWSAVGLLVMPSRAEGLPMAALEALANGIPLLATPVGALPTIVVPGQTGWLCDGLATPQTLSLIENWSALDGNAQLEMRRSCWTLAREGYSHATQLAPVLASYDAARLKAWLWPGRTTVPSNRPVDLDRAHP